MAQPKSWLDSALEVLQKGGRKTVRDIVSDIEQHQIRAVTGQTPEATVGAVLYTALQDGDPRVRLVGPGLFEYGINSPATSKLTLGRLESVPPREIWPDEARNFTPWMLDNAAYLGGVLGLEIELEAREHPIGPYYLDLFGRDISNQCVLIVENQLSTTDHRHLGQLLTYAAGTKPQAGTIVWIAPEFRDEHRDALNFLNSRVRGQSENQIRFFGVELGVVRIGNSVPAPQFTIVAAPSDWSEQMAEVQAAAAGGTRAQAYRAFWTRYLTALHKSAPQTTKVRSAPAANWITANYLRKGVSLNLTFIGGGLLTTEIYIDLGHRMRNLDVFYGLKDSAEEVESELGQTLLWDELPGKRACRIRLSRPGEITKPEDHDELIAWLLNYQIKFKQIFRSRVEDLPADIWDREIREDDSQSQEAGD